MHEKGVFSACAEVAATHILRYTCSLQMLPSLPLGHYRSYVRAFEGDKEVWLDCNDASVSPLTPAEQSSLFWFNCDSPKSTAAAVDGTTDLR